MGDRLVVRKVVMKGWPRRVRLMGQIVWTQGFLASLEMTHLGWDGLETRIYRGR